MTEGSFGIPRPIRHSYTESAEVQCIRDCIAETACKLNFHSTDKPTHFTLFQEEKLKKKIIYHNI